MKRLLRWLTRDFGRKLIALIFALALYSYVDKQLTEKLYFKVPVTIVPASDLVLGTHGTFHVDVEVKAPRETAAELRGENFQIALTVSAANLVDGKCMIDLKASDFPRRNGARVVGFRDPKQAHLTVNAYLLETKVVKVVQGRIIGQPGEGYQVKNVVLKPDKVEVSGAGIILDSCDQVESEPITVNRNNRENFNYEIGLKALPGVTMIPDRVNVAVEIEKTASALELKELPVLLLLGDEHRDLHVELLTPGKVNVTLVGSKSALGKIVRKDVHPYVDLTGVVKPGVHTLAPSCLGAGGEIRPGSITPGEIKVRISKAKR